MPSRKLTAHCPYCRCKNHLRAAYCNQCGRRLKEEHVRDTEGRAKLYADIAHPINSECREMIQQRVIAEFQSERERAQQPGYVSRYDEYFDYDDDPIVELPSNHSSRAHVEPPESEPRGPHRPRPGQRKSNTGNDPESGFGAGILD
jgi:stage V sporulation protein G